MTPAGAEPGDEPDPAVVQACPPAARGIFGDRLPMARRYAELLAGDGVLRGLIGPREPGRLWSRHLLNCAVVETLISPAASVVDIGSGAGLPGIPLAIARPDISMVLVEPLLRRTVFLEQAVAALGLANCRVIRGRADAVADACGGSDVATARAVAPLSKLAQWAAPLLRVGGELLALKGANAAAEIDRDAAAVHRNGITCLEVVTVRPHLMAEATLVVRGRRVGPDARGVPTRSARGRTPRAG